MNSDMVDHDAEPQIHGFLFDKTVWSLFGLLFVSMLAGHVLTNFVATCLIINGHCF